MVLTRQMNADNFMLSLPAVLAEDENLNALARSISATLEARVKEIERINIYARIDELPEDLLDILAYDFKVDWWDYSLTLTEKRKTLKRSWYVHKHMATPSAVTAALSAIYSETECEEWYEYGGEPYHYRLEMTLPAEEIQSTKHEKVLALLRFYKNLRSVLDRILYIVKTPIQHTLPVDSHVGHGMMSTGLPEIPFDYGFAAEIIPVAGQMNMMETILPEEMRTDLELTAQGIGDTVMIYRGIEAEGRGDTVVITTPDITARSEDDTIMIEL
jgi:phage tail P2-like protein